ncbi:BHLH domain-containing protein [Caerostris darwini]|uniref:BHLH domain-containing protein n=1 Tax=Caerostris darwini TaxID=1538125 RepID=A0AAV4TLX6_9ARAC|nr:BHLH domain-containing protein [Caerostris darwini]
MKAQQCDLQMAAKQMEQKLKSRVSKDRDVSQEEMQSLLCKLKTLVPYMPRHKKLSKLEIIQYVIDYIMDLQIALETHPAVPKPTVTTTTPIDSTAKIASKKTPLGLNTQGINASCELKPYEITVLDVIAPNVV